MHFFATINNDGRVVAIGDRADKQDLPNVVYVTEFDTALIGKLYKDGEFIEGPTIEPCADAVTDATDAATISATDFGALAAADTHTLHAMQADPQAETLTRLEQKLDRLLEIVQSQATKPARVRKPAKA